MRTAALLLSLTLATLALADGTVTTPANVAPSSWKIAAVHEITGANTDLAGVTISIYYFDASSNLVQSTNINLTSAEILSFVTMTNSAVAGESGSQIKRRRQRVTKWLIDNGKISNVTPE